MKNARVHLLQHAERRKRLEVGDAVAAVVRLGRETGDAFRVADRVCELVDLGRLDPRDIPRLADELDSAVSSGFSEMTRQALAPRSDARALADAIRGQHLTRSDAGKVSRQLGLPHGSVTVRWDAGAESTTRSQGAAGLARPGTVQLDPQQYQPGTRAGRKLLAHEMVHIAQFRAAPAAGGPDILAAEVEAAGLAQRFATSGHLTPVQQALPAYAVAADRGAKGADALLVKMRKRIGKTNRSLLEAWLLTDRSFAARAFAASEGYTSKSYGFFWELWQLGMHHNETVVLGWLCARAGLDKRGAAQFLAASAPWG